MAPVDRPTTLEKASDMIPFSNRLGLVIQAALKLEANSPRWNNVLAFVQSCYAGLVRTYDFDDALAQIRQLEYDRLHGDSF